MAVNLKKPHGEESDQLHKMATGIRNKLADQPSIKLLGKAYKPEALALLFDGDANTVGAYQKAIADLKQQRRELAAQQVLIRKRANSLHGAAVAALGADSADLAEFGFTPTKARVPMTGQQRVQTATRAAGTRKGMNTLGKRQRKAALAAVHQAQAATEAAKVAATTVNAEVDAVLSAPAVAGPGTTE